MDYVVLKDFSDTAQLNSEVFKQHQKEYQNMEYFTFRIESLKEKEELLKVGLKSESDYYSRIEYFSFKAQNDFKLIRGTDTLNCNLYHYERVYGLAPYATMLLGFPAQENKNTKQDMYLLFEDKTFKNGHIYLNIKQQDLASIPTLQL